MELPFGSAEGTNVFQTRHALQATGHMETLYVDALRRLVEADFA